MKQYIFKYALILLVACFGMQQAGAKVWYVNSSSVTWTGKDAGDVKTDIASAISAAAAGDEVWVAGGTFELSATVTLKNGVSLYGGFAGSETKIEDRKLVAEGNPWDFVNATILDGKTKFSVITGAKFTSSVVVDGFTIQNGKATKGGGLMSLANTVVRYCTFKKNSASDAGGGMNLEGANSLADQCYFTENSAKHGGGAALGTDGRMKNCLVAGNKTASTISTSWSLGWGGGIMCNNSTVESCEVYNNTASYGGGVYMREKNSAVYNSIIAHNTGHQGGGVSSDYRNGGGKVVNSVIAYNTSSNNVGGGAIFTKDGQNMTNCIFWENKLKSGELNDILSYDVDKKAEKTYAYVLRNCAFHGALDGISGTDHITLPEDSIAYFSAKWMPGEEFPGIDKGFAVDGLPTTDFAGNVRIAGRGIDIGAYESVIVPKPDGNVFYVDQDATGKMNGSSWKNAFLDIQTAINAAKVYNDENGVQTQLWIAAGTYDITAIISIQSGVSIYGGFDKTEKSLGERKMNSVDPWDFANPTVLKGNKTCQLINSIEPTNDKAITKATYINGFTMTGGLAAATGSGKDHYSCGGAAHLKQNMFVQNCIITGNEANNQGGGIALRGDANLCGIENCLVENNIANGAGGGISLFGNSTKNYVRNCVVRNNESKATGNNTGGGGIYVFLGTAENCIVTNNKALKGGGIAFRRYQSTSAVNCLIEGNTATVDAGAFFFSGHSSQAAVNIYNCTVVDNHTPAGMNLMGYSDREGNNKVNNFNNIKIVNSIFDKNDGVLANESLLPNMKITYSAFGQDITGEGNIVIPDDNSFWAENWHLAETSTAKNAGTKSGITILDYDLDGAERVQDGAIDMGAYEIGVIYAPDVNGVFYVKADGDDSNNGSSWENALQNISFALSKAEAYNKKLIGGQTPAKLWIAGNYELAEAIDLVDGVSMYGGFAGTETSLEERGKGAAAWEYTNPTVLKAATPGTITILNQSAVFTNATRVEGFTLKEGERGAVIKGNMTLSHCIIQGNNKSSGDKLDGGGIHASGKDAIGKCIIDSCLIDGNTGKNGGGVLVADGAVIKNSKVSNNNCVYTGAFDQGWGGGVFNNSAIVENCIIKGNAAPHGGGVFVRHADSKFYNCLVAGNSSTKTGGGVAFDSYSDHIAAVKDAKVYNFTIVNNTTEGEGAGIYFSNEGQTAINTILYGNQKAGNSADEYASRTGVTPLFTTCAILTTETLTEGNIALSADSKVFTDAQNDDWTLCEGSVCEDHGSAFDEIPVIALGGNVRTDGRRIDIGAYERESDFGYKASADGIVFVVSGADGQGCAWEDAVGDLNKAISIAKAYNDALEDEDLKKAQVWVKAGDYDLKESVLLNDGISIYGSFAGTEKTLEERTKGTKGWDYVNPTVLRGANKTFAVLLQQASFTAETTIDGFTVEEGMPGVVLLKNALLKCCIIRNCKSRTDNMTLADGSIINNNAGGVFVKQASTVDSCLIENNSSTSSGGGIYAENIAGIKIKNCLIQNNIAGTMGGGIFSWQATVENCIVKDNTATTDGGGIVVRQTASLYYNCIVAGNTAKGKGGGIWFKDADAAKNATVYNLTVVNNKAEGSGGGVYFGYAGQTLVNTILWGNTCNEADEQFATKSGVTATFTNCASSATLSEGNVSLPADAAGIFAENWMLCEGSPCIDKGKEVAELPKTDVYGNRRLSGEGYDIGACEYQTVLPYGPDANGVFYVNGAADQNGYGDSWNRPIKDLTTAIAAAKAWTKEYEKSSQIWVAKGTYLFLNTLDINTEVSIHGGFAGTESALEERQVKINGKPWEFENPTILDASSKCRVVAISADKVVFDGFTVQNGRTTGTGNDHALCGAGIYTMNGGVTIRNCIVKKNYCESVGAGIGIRTNSGEVIIGHCLVTENTGKNNGGGIGLYGNSASLTIRNCEITGNQGTNGGGVFMYRGKLENSVVTGNTGTNAGGVYLRAAGASAMYNCLVVENTTTGEGGSIYCQVANNTSIYNCTVTKNSGGGLYYKVTPTAIPVVNNIFWGNKKDGAILEFSAAAGQSAENASMTYTAADGDELMAGTGNMVLTQDSAAIFAGGWTLDILSPCIDKGNNEIAGMPATDLAGNPRKSNGMIDLGAYEFQAALDDFEINFKDETIALKADPEKIIECSASQSSWNTEPFSSLIQRDKSVIYCRVAGETNVYQIGLPGRYYPSAGIDFNLEKIVNVAENSTWNISGDEVEVLDSASLTSYVNNGVTGFTLVQPATDKAFRTDSVYQLPVRIGVPDLTLSFVNEKLNGVDETVDMTVYEVGNDMKAWQALTADASISALIPEAAADFTLFVRTKATETDFASLVKSWDLKGRPATPQYTINYADSMTNEVIAATVEYDTLGTFASGWRGAEQNLKLIPGKDYYFRIAASEADQVFVSYVDTLKVPAVSEMTNIRINYVEEKLEGLNEFVYWRVAGGNETQAQTDISTLISSEFDVTLTLYVPQGVNAFATPEYTFVLPKREAAPDWTINYSDEVIIETNDQLTPDNWEIKLPEATEYAKLDESGVLGSYIPTLEEGVRTLMLRTAAGVDAFHSEACEVVLSPRPQATNVAIDYATERTREVVPANVEYSVLDDMEAAVMGGDTTVVVEPGIDLYFRIKATESSFASAIQKLAVPERPAISEVTIDFENRTLMDLPLATVCQVGEGAIATAKEDLTDIIPAVGQPATTLKIWVPEQEGSFKSEVIELNLPAYPADPQLDIDYNKEALEGISGHMMWKYDDTTYAASADISGLIPAYGENERTLTVWVPASDTSFRSLGETEIVLPARKENLNAFSIDYLAETTQEMVADDIAYSYDPENEEWNIGDNAVAQLRPGVDIWFKRQANAANKQFASAVTKLEVPARPVITAEDMEIYLSDGEYIPEVRNSWTNTAEGLQMTISDPEVAVLNGTHIVPKKSGECQLTLALAAVVGEHFAAETKTVALKVISDGSTDGELAISNLKIAGRSDMVFRVPGLEGVSGVRLIMYNQWGKVIFEAKEYGHDFDMGNLDAGTYYYVLTYPKDGQQQKKKGFVEIVR